MQPPGWLKLLMVVAFGAIMLGFSRGVHFVSDTYGALWLLPALAAVFALAFLVQRLGWGTPELDEPRDPRPWRRRVGQRIATIGMGWAGLAIAPVFAPAGRFIERREAGSAVPSAAFAASLTFLFAAALWLLAVGVPVAFLVAYLARLFA